MNLALLIQGVLLGFAVTVPVGPIGVLCITRSINRNFAAGFFTGLGAAAADLVYGAITIFGLTIISDFLIEQKLWLQITGFVFLTILGVKTLLKKESDIDFNQQPDKGYLRDFISSFFLTLTNPLTILFLTAVFASMKLSSSESVLWPAIQLLSGIVFGSVTWWIFLSGVTQKMKRKIGKTFLRRIDLVSGMIFLFVALFVLADALENFI